MTSSIALRYIQEEAARYGSSPSEVMSRARSGSPANARRAVMNRLARDGYSVHQIAEWLNRDRSTVIHATRYQFRLDKLSKMRSYMAGREKEKMG